MKKKIMKAGLLLGAAILCAGTIVSASASVAFNYSNGNLAASATFDVITDGGVNYLTVLLENTSTKDVTAPSQILTAVFWDPAVSLTRVSAVVAAGSVVNNGGTDPGGVVGGEWAFKSGLSGAPGGAVLGISSAGFDLFGPGDVFPGSNLSGPADPDGLQYGITSAGDDPTTGNKKVAGDQPLIQNAVLFKLMIGDGTGTYDLDSIKNVQFQYGTSLSETPPPNVPEPATVFAGALLLLPFGLTTLQMIRKNRKM